MIKDEDEETNSPPGSGSGRGGTLGTPSGLPDVEPPTEDQDDNWVVSGGGLVGPDDDEGHSDAAGSSTPP